MTGGTNKGLLATALLAVASGGGRGSLEAALLGSGGPAIPIVPAEGYSRRSKMRQRRTWAAKRSRARNLMAKASRKRNRQ